MKRFVRILLRCLALFVGLMMVGGVVLAVLYFTADVTRPAPFHSVERLNVEHGQDGVMRCGNNRLLHHANGFWEMYIEGDAEQRGAAFGALADSLIDFQEEFFIKQIQQIVPNEKYLRFLNVLTQVFNRRITHHIPEEFCREIASMSDYCDPKYDFIGTPYLRQLNYHAAHDIGHVMQDYMLVGCTGVAAWGKSSKEGLLIGRNFDFWVGDAFAANRLITFCKPDSGYGYVSVGWPGMVGVMSGMNERGLCITLHASKGELSMQSATPVSILAREILQYASNIEEACRIASQRELFVSECFMVASKEDGRCVVIEKTPTQQDVFEPVGDKLALSNHFRSRKLVNEEVNVENIQMSDSKSRLDRAEELLNQLSPMNVKRIVSVLRDHASKGGVDLGFLNPMAINQHIAHHSVVFQPESLRMWISKGLWGYDEWVCYDVGAILRGDYPLEERPCMEEEAVAEDEYFMAETLPRMLQYKAIRTAPQKVNVDSLMMLNPMNWESYFLVGKFYEERGEQARVIETFEEALKHPIPQRERFNLEQKIKKIQND